MERKNSHTRHVNSTTAAARVAKVQNKRESLLLAKTSKGLSCETDGMLRSFFRQKAKANSFLQKVHGTNPGTLEPASYNEQGGQALADDKLGLLTGNGARDARKEMRERRISLDVNKTQETQKRIQEFMTRDLPGQRTRPRSADQKGKLNSRKIGDEVDERGSHSQTSRRNVSSATPFRVRTRTSGICFSHSHCHLLPLPSVHVPTTVRKNSSEPDFRPSSSYPGMRKSEFRRKLSTPIMVVPKMSLERDKLYEVKDPTDKTSKEKIVIARWSSTPVLTKTHSPEEYEHLFSIKEGDINPKSCLRLVPSLISEPVLRDSDEGLDLVYTVSFVSENQSVHVGKIRKMSMTDVFESLEGKIVTLNTRSHKSKRENDYLFSFPRVLK